MTKNKNTALFPANQILSDRFQQPYAMGMKHEIPQAANPEELTFINSKEAAVFLGISTKFLMNLNSEGRVPYFKFGRSNKYLKNELARLILENRRGPINGLQKR